MTKEQQLYQLLKTLTTDVLKVSCISDTEIARLELDTLYKNAIITIKEIYEDNQEKTGSGCATCENQ